MTMVIMMMMMMMIMIMMIMRMTVIIIMCFQRGNRTKSGKKGIKEKGIEGSQKRTKESR